MCIRHDWEDPPEDVLHLLKEPISYQKINLFFITKKKKNIFSEA